MVDVNRQTLTKHGRVHDSWAQDGLYKPPGKVTEVYIRGCYGNIMSVCRKRHSEDRHRQEGHGKVENPLLNSQYIT